MRSEENDGLIVVFAEEIGREIWQFKILWRLMINIFGTCPLLRAKKRNNE